MVGDCWNIFEIIKGHVFKVMSLNYLIKSNVSWLFTKWYDYPNGYVFGIVISI